MQKSLSPARPTSAFLHHAIHTRPAGIKYDISGSTPPNLFTSAELAIQSAMQYDERPIVLERLTKKTLNLLKLDQENHSVTFSCSASQAFTQALATITKPGDTIVIEKPNYEPFVKTAMFLNLKIKYFSRGEAHAPSASERDFKNLKNQANKNRTLVLTNPHFPLGGIYDEKTLKKYAKLFKYVLIDEVFLPQFKNGQATQFIGSLPSNILVTGGVAKAIGLGTVRLGWIVSTKKFADALARMAYHFHIEMPFPILLVAERGIDLWQLALDRLEKITSDNRIVLQKWAKQNPGYFSHDLKSGNWALLKVGNAKTFTQKMITDGILIKDGSLVGMPKHVRICWQIDHENFKKIWQKILVNMKQEFSGSMRQNFRSKRHHPKRRRSRQ